MSASLLICILLTRTLRFRTSRRARVRRALLAIPRRVPLLTYWTFKSRLRAFALRLIAGALVGDKGHQGSDAIGTLHVAHFVPFENNHIGFFTIFDGDFAKYIQDFADKNSLIFDTLFPHVIGAPPTPVAKNAQAFHQWALDRRTRPSGFTAPIQASRFWTFEPCWPIASYNRPLDSTGVSSSRTRIIRRHVVGAGEHNTSSTVEGALRGFFADCLEGWRFGGPGRVGARPRGHSGVHSPRLQNADGAAFLADGRNSGTSAQATRTARKRRRIRGPANHDRRDWYVGWPPDPQTIPRTPRVVSPTIALTSVSLFARPGCAGDQRTRPNTLFQVIWCVHRRSRATSGVGRRYRSKFAAELD